MAAVWKVKRRFDSVPRNTRQLAVFTAFLFLSLIFAPTVSSQQRIYTVAGGYVGDGGPATAAGLAFPQYAIFDTHENLLISDAQNCRIRSVDKNGNISTIAGTGICGFSGDGRKAVKAEINFPAGLVLDAAGDIFFSDEGNSRIRKIDRSGRIATVAGNGTFQYCGDGGRALSACLNYPTALAVVGSPHHERLLIADTFNYRVRQLVMRTGTIATIAGNGTAGYSGDGGPAKLASLNAPQGLAVSLSSHTIWISDANNSVIRKVDIRTGVITTYFGNVICGFDPQSLCFPRGISADNSDNLYVAGALQVVEIRAGANSAIVLAGILGEGFNGDGIPATSAMLNNSWDAILDPAGSVLIVDAGNGRVRKGTGSHAISTVAGGYIGDGGQGTSASLSFVSTSIVFDSSGTLYIADGWNNRIRKLTHGSISTFAGTGLTGYSGDGGPATSAMLNLPNAVAADKNGNVFIADGFNNVVRRVDSLGNITTFAGFGVLQDPVALATDDSGNVYTADQTCLVWKITPDGSMSIAAGNGQCGPGQDGVPATVSALQFPSGLAVDSRGDLYIADTSNNRIRVVNTAGIINTVAGNGTCGFSGDGGPAKDAMLCGPTGVAVDSNHNIYIGDTLNFRARVVNSSGTIQTVAGNGDFGYNGNGLPALQTSIEPYSVVLSPAGKVFLLDATSDRVREIRCDATESFGSSVLRELRHDPDVGLCARWE
jgi:sugar lactone lactonase YvrE